MKTDVLVHNLRTLLYQRNALLGLCCMLAVATTAQSFFLFTKQERVVVVPPYLDKPISFDGRRPSASYLEQYGVFLGDLLLGKSAQTSGWQREIILKNTSPEFSSSLRQKLIEEEQTLKGQSVSYVFFANYVETRPEAMEVFLDGERISYIGGKQVTKARERYRLGFVFHGGRLLLDSLQEVSS